MKIRDYVRNLKEQHIYLKLNEDNIEVESLDEKISDETLQYIASRKSEIVDYLRLLFIEKNDFLQIENVGERAYYPLSYGQKRLWTLSQLSEGNKAYNAQDIYELNGELDIAAFKESFRWLIERHEVLRTVFRGSESGEVFQYILKGEDYFFDIQVKDFTSASNPESELEKYAKDNNEKIFNLEYGPLIEGALIKRANNQYVFIYLMHHIICDGWSRTIIMRDLIHKYNSLVTSDEYDFPNLRIQYKDYSVWQENKFKEEKFDDYKSYWLNQLEGNLSSFTVQGDKLRPKIKTYNGGLITRRINKDYTKKLKKLVNNEGVTLYMGLLSITKTLLYHYTNQTDIIIGCPVAGREHIDLESQIGFYVNTLPIRTRFAGKDTFRQLLKNIARVTTEAYDYQSYPFDKIVDDLNIPIDISGHPLFNIMIALQNNDLVSFNNQVELSNGLEVKMQNSAKNLTSKFDLLFDFVEIGGEIHSTLQYNSDIYHNSTVERMMDHFIQVAASTIDNPDIAVDLLDLVTGSERDKLLHQFNNTNRIYPKDQSIISLFEETVLNNAQNIAISFENDHITYEGLNERANRLAHLFRSEFKIQKGDTIGILKSRSAEYIITVLAMLKAGAAYLPLEGEAPNDRLRLIIENSKLGFLISEDSYLEKIAQFTSIDNLKILVVNDSALCSSDVYEFKHANENHPKRYDLSVQPVENLGIDMQSNDVAYIIHTSGTTGIPKGVVIQHQSVIKLVKEANYISIKPADALLSFSNFSFDGSIFDIFGSLLNGAKLVIPIQQSLSDLIEIDGIIKKEKVTVFFVTTALFNEMVEHSLPGIYSVNCILFGGEKVSVRHVDKFKKIYPKVRLLHVYGPTENTTFSTFYEIDKLTENQSTIPIGKAISNTRCYVLNGQGKLRPVGVPGELCLAGDGLSIGYLNDLDLTAAKFIANPLVANEKIYKTGDLVRWTPQGDIEFIGRNDSQVKIRGFRIEISEIEKTILNYKSISEVLVLAQPNPLLEDDIELYAYVVGEEKLDIQKLKSDLGNHLPSYMIPAHFVQIDKMPLNKNGKVDKKKLADFYEALDYVEKDEDKLTTENEFKLAKIWKEILGLEKVGRNDNFFENGGHSLKATKLVNHVYKEFDIKLDLRDLFTSTLLKEQVSLIEEAMASTYIGIKPIQKAEYYSLSASQRRLWILSQFEGGNKAYNICGKYEFEGALDIDALKRAYQSLVERHEVLRTVFRQNDLGEVKQWVFQTKDVKDNFKYLDFSQVADADEQIKLLVQAESEYEFDLENGPLINATVIQYSPANFIFVFVIHHVIADGWSIPIIIKELSQFYNAYRNGQKPAVEPLRIHYKDFVYWQMEQMNKESYSEARDYWIRQFSGDIPLLEMTLDTERAVMKSFKGGGISFTISKQITEKLKALFANEDATLFMGLLGLVTVLLNKYTNKEDIIYGTPIAGREHVDLEEQVGFYVNTLPLRVQFEKEKSFRSLLSKIKQITLDAYKYQVYPFDELIKNLDITRQNNRQPLFDIMVTLHNIETDQVDYWQESFTNLKVSPYLEAEHTVSKFDLNFDFRETASETFCMLEYDSDLFTKETITGFIKHFNQIIEQVIIQPDVPVNALNCLAESETDQLLIDFNDTDVWIDPDKTIVDLFEEQVQKTPYATALVCGEKTYAYTDLNKKINQLARYLETFSLDKNTTVFVHIDRSEWSAICMIAVLKAGAIYVPVDKAWPIHRIDYILKKSDRIVIIADDPKLSSYSEIIIRIDQELPLSKFENHDLKKKITHDSASYIIYTSGSTGNPKGVRQTHLTLYNLMSWEIMRSGLLHHKKFLQFNSYAFDASLNDVFFALSTGGELHIIKQDIIDNLVLLKDYLIDCKIEILSLPYAVLNTLFNEIDIDFGDHSLQNIISTGEQMYVTGKLREFLIQNPQIVLFNFYGPSETHVVTAISYSFNKGPVPLKSTVGKPIDNSKIYILNDDGKLVPVGVEGELYIGGSNLALGYDSELKLTSEVFLKNTLEENTLFYKTGDRAKWLPNGEIEYLGRKDHQVKINGFRVELEEIELALNGHPGIHKAVVLEQKDVAGMNALSAYIVAEEGITIENIRTFLKLSLPEYMIPNTFVVIDKVPLTPTGKIDKRKLLLNKGIKMTNDIVYVAARNDIEENLVKMWSNILDVKNIGVRDNFFSLGGHSLKATIVLTRIYAVYGIKLSVETFFQFPTIEHLSDHISERVEAKKEKIEENENTDVESFLI